MIKPIQNFTNYVQRKLYQREAARVSVDKLHDLFDNFDYYQVFKSKNGAVAALGFDKKQGGLYKCAYSILPNGDTIQTLASRGSKTNDGVTDFFTRLIRHSDGRCEVKTSSVQKMFKVHNDSAKFSFNIKSNPVIDIMELLEKK